MVYIYLLNLKNVRVHDIELFPNAFFEIFKEAREKRLWICIIHEDYPKGFSDDFYNTVRNLFDSYDITFFNTIEEMLFWITSHSYLFIGYNDYEFDNPVLTWISRNYKSLYTSQGLSGFLSELYKAGGAMLEDNTQYKSNSVVKNSSDLMRVGNLRAIYKPLKQASGNLRFPRMKEYKHAFGKPIPQGKILEVLDYELNDVLITERLLLGVPDDDCSICTPPAARYGLLGELELRESLGKEYHVNLLNEGRSGMGNILNNKLYERKSGIKLEDFKGLRTGYDTLKYSDVIFDSITFKTPELQEFLTMLKGIKIDVKNLVREGDELYQVDTKLWRSMAKQKLTFERTFCELPITFGAGGLHSNQSAQVFSSTEETDLRDADASSFYPFIIINNNLYPKHLGAVFVRYYTGIVEDRIKAKAAGDKTKAAAMKILVNAVFGKLNFSNYWLCDLQAFLSVTVNGQLFLLMLIEELYLAGIKSFYANTDGVSSYVPKNKLDEYNRICGYIDDHGKKVEGSWEKYTGFVLETEQFKKMFHRDCNNYLVLTESGKIKAKGQYDWRRYIEKYSSFDVSGSFVCPIVPYAVEQYFVYNVPIEKTLYEHKDILDFTICGKIGTQFEPVYINTVTGTSERQQQSLRYYIAKSPYKLLKRKRETEVSEMGLFGESSHEKIRDTDVSVGYNVLIMNDVIRHDDFSEYHIDYSYYIRECNKLIDDIMVVKEESQYSLFDMDKLREQKKPMQESLFHLPTREHDQDYCFVSGTWTLHVTLLDTTDSSELEEALVSLGIICSSQPSGGCPVLIHIGDTIIRAGQSFFHQRNDYLVDFLNSRGFSAEYEEGLYVQRD